MIYYYCAIENCLFISNGTLVYRLYVPFNDLCKMFWDNDPIWVQYFGKVTRGVGYHAYLFDVKPCPQVSCKPIEYWITKNRDNWEVDFNRSLHYSLVKIREYIEEKRSKLLIN